VTLNPHQIHRPLFPYPPQTRHPLLNPLRLSFSRAGPCMAGSCDRDRRVRVDDERPSSLHVLQEPEKGALYSGNLGFESRLLRAK
jgi:hypothetical protein